MANTTGAELADDGDSSGWRRQCTTHQQRAPPPLPTPSGQRSSSWPTDLCDPGWQLAPRVIISELLPSSTPASAGLLFFAIAISRIARRRLVHGHAFAKVQRCAGAVASQDYKSASLRHRRLGAQREPRVMMRLVIFVLRGTVLRCLLQTADRAGKLPVRMDGEHRRAPRLSQRRLSKRARGTPKADRPQKNEEGPEPRRDLAEELDPDIRTEREAARNVRRTLLIEQSPGLLLHPLDTQRRFSSIIPRSRTRTRRHGVLPTPRLIVVLIIGRIGLGATAQIGRC